MNVGVVQFIFESNTFNPNIGELNLFTGGGIWLTDAAEIRRWSANSHSQFRGSIELLETAGCDVFPIWVAVCGTPGGRLSANALLAIKSTLQSQMADAEQLDILLLHLHGAVCAEGEDDVEGALLEWIRSGLQFKGKVVVSLDLHANVTQRMLAHCDVVTAYRTMPHVDLFETGVRAASHAIHVDETVRTLAKVKGLIPPTSTSHMNGGFRDLLSLARQMETYDGILDISVFPVQPWMDVEELGCGVVVTSTPQAAKRAESIAAEVAHTWYDQRSEWAAPINDWSHITEILRKPTDETWILVDAADATTGGSDGKSAEAIERLWPLRDVLPGDVYLWVVDPEAVQSAKVDATHFELGSQRVSIAANPLFRGECRYQARGRAYNGQTFSSGESIVLESGRLKILVTSTGSICADPAFYECVGLTPAKAHAVQVKSLMGWLAGYDVPMQRGLIFCGPGNTSLDFARLPFTGARRALYPIEQELESPVTIWQST